MRKYDYGVALYPPPEVGGFTATEDKFEINVGSMSGSTSSLTLKQFYQLLEVLASSYLQSFSNDESKVKDYLAQIKKRYAKLISQSDDDLIALSKQRLTNPEPSFEVNLDDL